MTSDFLTLAQTTTAPATQPPGGSLLTFLPFVLALVVFYWWLFRSQKKDRQRQEQVLNSVKRSDRVLTIGGIYGTVVDVRDTEIVLKVDETNNVKIRFHRSAIKEVFRETTPEPAK
ncbi:MAG: preprotein translocase subunit YajC [Phycisphaerae bacterium]